MGSEAFVSTSGSTYCRNVRFGEAARVYSVWKNYTVSNDKSLSKAGLHTRKTSSDSMKRLLRWDVDDATSGERKQRFLSIFFSSMVRWHSNAAVMRTRCCVLECSTICLPTLTTFYVRLSSTFWFTACFGFCSTAFDVRVLWEVCRCTSITTRCSCRGATLSSARKSLRMQRSANGVQSGIFIAKCGSSPNLIQMHSLPRWRCRRIKPMREAVARLLFVVVVLFYFKCG